MAQALSVRSLWSARPPRLISFAVLLCRLCEQKPDMHLLSLLDDICVEQSEGDVVDGLLVAMEMLHRRVGKYKFAKKILLFTDAAAPITDDPDGMQTIIDGLRALEYKLSIVGVNFSEVESDEESGSDDVAFVRQSSTASSRTQVQKDNERVLRDLAHRCNGEVFTVDSAIGLLANFKRRVNQVTKYRGPLEIGSVKINVCSYTQTALTNLPSMKRIAVPVDEDGVEKKEDGRRAEGAEEKEAAAEEGGDGEGEEDDGQSTISRASRGGGQIKQDRSYWNKRGDGPEQQVTDKIKAFRYGKDMVRQHITRRETTHPSRTTPARLTDTAVLCCLALQVPFDEDELALLKYESERCLQVLAFAPADAIKRYQYMSGVDCVAAAPGDVEAQRALSAFAWSMTELRRTALCRYVARKNARPMLVALLPDIARADGSEALLLVQLPFADDMRDFAFPGLDSQPVFVPTDQQRAVARDLVRAMSLDRVSVDASGEPLSMEPETTFNPVLQRFYQTVENRAQDPSAPIPPVPPAILRHVTPDATLLKDAEPSYDAFRLAFSLVEAPKKEGGRRRVKFSMYDEKPQLDDDILDAKTGRDAAADSLDADGGGGGGGDELMRDRVDAVSTVNPVETFRAMLRRRDDVSVHERAMREMVARIDAFVEGSYGDQLYGRAMECVRALREACVRDREAHTFNEWLEASKARHKSGRSEWWKFMQREGVRLIDQGEVEDSKYTAADAARWWEDDAVDSKSRSESIPVSGAADDLFDELQ